MRGYFKGSRLTRMSDGTYCIVRDLGLVKGGKGLRHFENLLTLSVRGLASKVVEMIRHQAKRFQNFRVRKIAEAGVAGSLEH